MKHLLLSAVFACGASLASAATLDFDLPGTEFGNPIAFGGFDFDFDASGWFIGDPDNAIYPQGVTNGTGILVASGDRFSASATVTMTRQGGGTFDIFGLLAASSNQFVGNTVEIVGQLFGGGTVSTTLNVGGSFASFALTGFEDLTSVMFTSGLSGFYNDAGFALDDIELDFTTSQVPVPASLPLLLVGLGGIAMVRRARRA